jgi:hypothetical protein
MRTPTSLSLIVLLGISLWALAQTRPQPSVQSNLQPAAVTDPPIDNLLAYIGPIPQKISDIPPRSVG